MIIKALIAMAMIATTADVSAQTPCSSVPEEAQYLLPGVLEHFTASGAGADAYRAAMNVSQLPPTTMPEPLYQFPALCEAIRDTSLATLKDEPLGDSIGELGYHHFIWKFGPYYIMIVNDGPFTMGFPDRLRTPYEVFVYDFDGQTLELRGRGIM